MMGIKAKEYLKKIHRIDMKIANRTYELQQLKSIASSVSAPVNQERVQSSGRKDKMSCLVDKYVDIEREIDSLVKAKQDIIKTIEALDGVEYNMLHMIYVQQKTYTEVASEIDRSYSTVTSMHSKAIKNLQKILDKERYNDRKSIK